MSILKSELKQMVTHEIGVRVEDALESAKRELAVLEGRQTAFLDGSKVIEALLKTVDEEITAGKYDLATGEVAKRFIQRSSQAMQNLSKQANNYHTAQAGKVQGFEHTVKLLANLVEVEKQKIAQIQAQAAEQGTHLSAVPSPATVPVEDLARPVSIKQQRLAEEAASAATAALPVPPEPPAPVAPVAVVETMLPAVVETPVPVATAPVPVAAPVAEVLESVEEEEDTRKRRKGKRRAANA